MILVLRSRAAVAAVLARLAALMMVGVAVLAACSGGDAANSSAGSPMPLPSATPAPRGLVFRSGFEEGVQLEAPRLEFGQQWRQSLRGADAGFDWAAAFPARLANFQYLVYAADAADEDGLKRFVSTRIDTVAGPRGLPTRALYQEVTRRGGASTQNDFILFDWNPSKTQGYLRYWLKLQPDLDKVLAAPGHWRLLNEWKEAPSGPGYILDFEYRWGLYVSRVATPQYSGLAWKVEASRAEPGVPGFTTDWAKWNYTVPVPRGEWFLVEIDWVNHREQGSLSVRVNGQVIAEHSGATQRTSSNGKLYLSMVYTAVESTDIGPAYQWIDDVELWEAGPGR